MVSSSILLLQCCSQWLVLYGLCYVCARGAVGHFSRVGRVAPRLYVLYFDRSAKLPSIGIALLGLPPSSPAAQCGVKLLALGQYEWIMVSQCSFNVCLSYYWPCCVTPLMRAPTSGERHFVCLESVSSPLLSPFLETALFCQHYKNSQMTIGDPGLPNFSWIVFSHQAQEFFSWL